MENRFCEYCGAQMAHDDMFCPACGKRPSAVDNARLTADSYRQPPQPPQQPQYQPPQQHPAFGYNHPSTQPKPAGRGMALWIVIGVLAVALIVTVVLLLTRRDETEDAPESVSRSSASTSASLRASASSSAPEDEEIVPVEEATLADIDGDWRGEFEFTRLEGYENLPDGQRPPDIVQLVEQTLAEKQNMHFDIRPDGVWVIDINGPIRVNINASTDFGSPSPVKIERIENGVFALSFDDGSSAFELNCTVAENGDGMMLVGELLSTTEDGAVLTREGTFKLTNFKPDTTSVVSESEASLAPAANAADYSLADIAGVWQGELNVLDINFESDTMPPEELEEYLESYKEYIDTTEPFELELGADGSWMLDAGDFVSGLGSDYLTPKAGTTSDPIIGELEDGTFTLSFTGEFEGTPIGILFTGIVSEDAGGLLLEGMFELSSTQDGTSMIVDSEYTARLAGE